MSQSSRETDGKLAFPKGKARDHFCIIRHCCRGITYTFPLPHWFCPMCNLIHSLDLDLFLGWLLMSSPAIPQRLQREASGSYHCWKFVLCHWTAEVWLDDLQSWSFNIGCRLFWCGFTMDMFFFCAFQLRLLNHEKRLKSLRLIFFQVGFVLKNDIISWFVARGAYDYLCTLRSCVTCAFVQSVLASGEKCKEIGCGLCG